MVPTVNFNEKEKLAKDKRFPTVFNLIRDRFSDDLPYELCPFSLKKLPVVIIPPNLFPLFGAAQHVM